MISQYNEHTPVMLTEVLSFLPEKKKFTYLDMTLGRAGHAREIIKRMENGSTFIGNDRDSQAIEYSSKILLEYPEVKQYFIKERFSKVIPILKRNGIKEADFILMDIGVSSPQFDDPERGFSYRYDAPLDMRMDKSEGVKASDIVNEYSEAELVRVFKDLGQCKIYLPVVKAILKKRETKRIETTSELVDIIKSSLPYKELNKKGHPAKQFFLGLRYEVNHEIDELKDSVKQALEYLSKGGRLVIISFNSEEDKIVKDAYNEVVSRRHVDKYSTKDDESSYKLLSRKPLVPSEKEIEENSRCKSSIMRVIERR